MVRLAPAGWKAERLQASESIQPCVEESAHTVSDRETRSAWSRLIAQVYEGCAPRCPLDLQSMRILAVITEPEEVRKILRHLVKVGRPPPELEQSFV